MRIKERLYRLKWYFDRGMEHIGFVKQLFYLAIGLEILEDYIPAGWNVYLLIAFVPCVAVLGWLDIHKLKLYQWDAMWGAYKVNPYGKEVLDRIRKIEKNGGG